MITMQKFVIWIQIALSFTSKQMIFIMKLQKILKLDLILQIMNKIDRYQNEKIKKANGSMKDKSQ